MSGNAVTAVGWIAIAFMVLGVSYCTLEINKDQNARSAEREKACWDRGGFWNSTGWNGAWCQMEKPQ